VHRVPCQGCVRQSVNDVSSLGPKKRRQDVQQTFCASGLHRADIKYSLSGPAIRLRVELHVVPMQALVSYSCVDGYREHSVSMFSL
jgi:hypothetical protein